MLIMLSSKLCQFGMCSQFDESPTFQPIIKIDEIETVLVIKQVNILK